MNPNSPTLLVFAGTLGAVVSVAAGRSALAMLSVVALGLVIGSAVFLAGRSGS